MKEALEGEHMTGRGTPHDAAHVTRSPKTSSPRHCTQVGAFEAVRILTDPY
ncbi:MAG: hypothetical protein AAGI48_06950 [Verrucomicrobiota bacterium]